MAEVLSMAGELSSLLQPISEERPTGVDVRESSTDNALYRQIKQARAKARTLERQALMEHEAGNEAYTHWQAIAELAPRLLTESSKDLEVTAWLIEAQLRLRGFAGLKDAFALTAELVNQFWPTLYPEPDEEGIETKVAALSGLNGESSEGTLIRPLRLQPITQVGAGDRVYTWSDYHQAHELSKISDADQRLEREQALGFSLDSIRQAMTHSDDAFCAELKVSLEQCLEHFNQLSDQLYEHCGIEAPPSSRIKETLMTIQQAVADLTQGRAQPLGLAERDEQAEEEAAAPLQSPSFSGQMLGTEPARGLMSATVHNREEALQALSQIAVFFRQTEPHSPLPGLLERAVRWGRMPIEALISELLPELSAQHTFEQLTGISPKGDRPSAIDPTPEPQKQTSQENLTASEGVW